MFYCSFNKKYHHMIVYVSTQQLKVRKLKRWTEQMVIARLNKDRELINYSSGKYYRVY